MKTRTVKLMLMATALFSFALIAGCSDDDKKSDPADDRSELTASIAQATELLATTEEGTEEDQFPAGSQQDLQDAIDAATEVLMDEDASQKKVNAANANLQAAITAYMDLKNAPIAAADLVGRWKFDEGSGTTAFDDSENGFDGTFKSGPVAWGAGTPTWTEDRHGNPNRAIAFDEGANIEVPYNAKLNPEQISISVWVSAAEIRESNRFIGLQSWIGYKFQLQSTNRPYFTINTDEGTREEDATVQLPLDEWHHLVTTFGGGKLKFYIDGVMVKEWDKTGDGKSISDKPYNLVFGQDFPTDKYSAGDGSNFDVVGSPDYQVIPLAWGGYYHGSLDEIRIYKTVLTAGQVTSIYNNEKPAE